MIKALRDISDTLKSIYRGLKVTRRNMKEDRVTIQYPEEELHLPERERNRLYVNMDDCIGCYQCARACPVNCIDIETVKADKGEDLGKTSQGKKKALHVTKFDIDFAKCCYCELCVDPCPTDCITMTKVFEFSTDKREKLIYHFATLTPDERTLIKNKKQ